MGNLENLIGNISSGDNRAISVDYMDSQGERIGTVLYSSPKRLEVDAICMKISKRIDGLPEYGSLGEESEIVTVPDSVYEEILDNQGRLYLNEKDLGGAVLDNNYSN